MNKQRVMVASIFAGLAVVVLLVFSVLQFGRRDPSPPSMQKNPNSAVTGEVMYLSNDGCVMRIDASGANRKQVVCPNKVDFLVRLDERTIVYGYYGGLNATATQRDLVTGAETSYGSSASFEKFGPGSMSEPRSIKGESVDVERDGTIYRTSSSDPTRVKIFDCDCAEYNVPEFVTWSPDGQWVLMTYWHSREQNRELWVIARDGSYSGTLASDLSEQGMGPFDAGSWFIAGSGTGTGLLPKSSMTPVSK